METIPAKSIEIKLDVPYTTLGGRSVESVTMRAPTVRDRLLHMKSTKPDSEADLDMIARLVDMPVDDLMDMEACDYLRLEREFNNFLRPPAKRIKPE